MTPGTNLGIDPDLDPDFAPDGLDGGSGAYLHPGLSLAELVPWMEAPPKASKQAQQYRAPRESVDPRSLASAGWAVVFPEGCDPAVREALSPLLNRRREQAGEHYLEITGFRPDETLWDLLDRCGAAPGAAADPERLPYYVLLVGGPEEISWEVQSGLEVQYAVGRLAFDSAEDYGRYAGHALAAERRTGPFTRRATFFGTRNPDDRATELICEHLVDKTASFLLKKRPDWKTATVAPGEATRERLGGLLQGGEGTPSLLFASGHGLGFGLGHPAQRERQGALVCSGWPGPKQWAGPVAPEHVFAAEDLPADARPDGLIAFLYACHGAGTPATETCGQDAAGEPRSLAPRPFVARLPQRLLAAGALAVVGHVDRTWGYSFVWKGAGGNPAVFQDSLLRLLDGHPLGSALEPFGERAGGLASALGQSIPKGVPGGDKLRARLWTAARDAAYYVVLGDPAVRLPGASPRTAGSVG